MSLCLLCVCVYIYVRASRSTTLSSNNVLLDVRNFQNQKQKQNNSK